jgi:hypothetical protein
VPFALEPVGHIGNPPYLGARFLGIENNPVFQYPRHMNGSPDSSVTVSRFLVFLCQIYWRVDTFTRYLGGFLVAPKGIFIDGNKIIE